MKQRKKTVVLGVSGGIAAFKACQLASNCIKRGVDVRVIMTENATKFVAPLTFESLTNAPVAVGMFEAKINWEIEHIALAKRADVLAVVPATANILAKMAHGVADDMLSTVLLATRAPVVVAPAMNTAMYEHAATQDNLALLRRRGVAVVEPAVGRLACGDEGSGKLADVAEIEEAIAIALCEQKDLAGKTVMVTAGPTREALDPVRYLSNRSSGRMGYALARAALQRGAKVILVSGPVDIAPPYGVELVAVETADHMYDAVMRLFPTCDMIIKAAAPADFKPQEASSEKIKKQPGDTGLHVDFVQNRDIAAALGAQKRPGQVLVCFAAETHAALAHAREKLIAKHADLIMVNDVTMPGAGFDTTTNIITVMDQTGIVRELPLMEKTDIAHEVLDEAVKKLP